MRSIPEKTLEHWISLYASYRYRSFAGLWWPTSGEDIAVGTIRPPGPGKIFNVEVKTTEATTATSHLAEVRVAQLLNYLAKPVPTYYVFPIPGWSGAIDQAAAQPWLAGMSKAEMGFKRSGDNWFGNWVVVIPDYVLYRPLAARYPLGTPVSKGVYEPVFTVRLRSSGVSVRMEGAYAPPMAAPRSLGLPGIQVLRWQEFWDDMDACGGPARLQALFAVPSGGSGGEVPRQALVAKVEAAGLEGPFGEVEFYAPRDRARVPEASEDLYVPVSPYQNDAVQHTETEEESDLDVQLISVFVSAERIATARQARY